jgi:hypothetical protein
MPAAAVAPLRERIRTALDSKDLDALSRVAWFAGLAGEGEAYERLVASELVASSPEVQEYWGSECSCGEALH